MLREWRDLELVTPLTLRASLRCINLALWDEDTRKLVPFRAIQENLNWSSPRPWSIEDLSGRVKSGKPA